MKISIKPYRLPLKHTFTIAHGSRTHQDAAVVTLEKNGQYGIGEATAVSYYGLSIEEMIGTFQSKIAALEAIPFENPKQFWEVCQPIISKVPFLQCALDVAAYDCYAKLSQKPLYELWGLNINQLPLSNYTIGIDSVDTMVTKMQEVPWPVYKIKLGTQNDLEIVKALRQHTDAKFRVDANTGWTAKQTLELAPQLKELGVEFIEQPLKVTDWEGMKLLKAESPIPIIADESCQLLTDVEKCAEHFHGINIKIMKCGGLTPALEMIKLARERNIEIMVGCMAESSVGISGIAHLLPLIDYADMDGAMLLGEDIASGVHFKAGIAQFPDRFGTGAVLV
ncbi:MAG: dipeptide epimerase [Bacteroidota bacterium]